MWAGLHTEALQAVRAIPDQEGKGDDRVLRAVETVKDDIIHSPSYVLAKAWMLKRGEELSQEGQGRVGVVRRDRRWGQFLMAVGCDVETLPA